MVIAKASIWFMWATSTECDVGKKLNKIQFQNIKFNKTIPLNYMDMHIFNQETGGLLWVWGQFALQCKV